MAFLNKFSLDSLWHVFEVASRQAERRSLSKRESVTVNGGHFCSASFDLLENFTD